IAYTQGNQDKMKLFKEMASTIEKDVESLEKHVQSLIQKEEDWAKEDPENRLIEMEEKEGLCSGQKIRTTILKTKFIYPFIRQEEVIDTTTGKILNKVEMVADHLLVRLKEEESEKEFLHNLELYLKQKKFSYSEMKLKKISSNPSLYQLDFSTTFQSGSSLLAIMANIIEVVKSNKLAQSCNPDFLMSSFSDPDDPLYEKQVSLNPQFDYGIQAPHNLFSSTNPAIPIPTNPANSIIIAIIDSGITPNHEDLIDNIISARDASGRLSFYGFDALEENPLLKYRPRDMSGHGTHCSGIIAASVNNKTGIAGMAGVPGMVKLLACNCFDRTTKKASCTHAINCIDYARRNGARILNCSWGRPQSSDESSIGFSNNGCQDLENAFKKQPKKPCVVITAAGNSGSNNNNFPIYPANYVLSNLVTVAATTYTGTGLWVGLKKASNFGKETVHLAAPGHDILSTWPRPVLQGSGKPSIPYQYKSGTSMAAPHITATLALMMLKFPDLSENEIIKRLFRTSDQEPLIKTKYGRLNLTQALTSYDIEGSKDDESSNSNDELLLWGTKPKHSICDK
ncbi:MAG TPA: S8 family serine peptidase, partial [Chthoniobacterales bacterium]|nr:S8 family serine peptidase [Chthoniobacterales bacterium]